jgi:hypothetical protein
VTAARVSRALAKGVYALDSSIADCGAHAETCVIDHLLMQSRAGCLRAAADVPHLTAGDWNVAKGLVRAVRAQERITIVRAVTAGASFVLLGVSASRGPRPSTLGIVASKCQVELCSSTHEQRRWRRRPGSPKETAALPATGVEPMSRRATTPGRCRIWGLGNHLRGSVALLAATTKTR